MPNIYGVHMCIVHLITSLHRIVDPLRVWILIYAISIFRYYLTQLRTLPVLRQSSNLNLIGGNVYASEAVAFRPQYSQQFHDGDIFKGR